MLRFYQFYFHLIKLTKKYQTVHKAHDALFKAFTENKKVSEKLLLFSFSKKHQKDINFESAELASPSFIHTRLSQSQTDVLYKFHKAGKPAYLLIEQQSTADANIVFRCIKYSQHIADRHIQQQQAKKLPAKYPLIFALVLYHGQKSPYPYSYKLQDHFEAPQTLQTPPLIYSFKDLNLIPDSTLEKQGAASWLLLLLKHAFDRNLYHWTKKYFKTSKILKWLKEGGTVENLEISLRYLAHQIPTDPTGSVSQHGQKNLTKDEKIRDLFRTLRDTLNTEDTLKGDSEMTSMAEYLIERGNGKGMVEGLKTVMIECQKLEVMKEGIKQGMQQGMQQGMLNFARTMLSHGYPMEEIKKITKLPLKKIREIQQNSQSSR
jgi:predicted transposase YdaD